MSAGIALAVIQCIVVGLPELSKIIENICTTMNVRSQERSGITPKTKSRADMTDSELAEVDLGELCERFEALQLSLNYVLSEGCNEREAEDLRSQFDSLKRDVEIYCEKYPEAKAGEALQKSVQFGQTVIDSQLSSSVGSSMATVNKSEDVSLLDTSDRGSVPREIAGTAISDDVSDVETHLFTQ